MVASELFGRIPAAQSHKQGWAFCGPDQPTGRAATNGRGLSRRDTFRALCGPLILRPARQDGELRFTAVEARTEVHHRHLAGQADGVALG